MQVDVRMAIYDQRVAEKNKAMGHWFQHQIETTQKLNRVYHVFLLPSVFLISLASCIFAIPQSRNFQQEWSRVGCELTLERALYLSPDMYKANSFGRIMECSRLDQWNLETTSD